MDAPNSIEFSFPSLAKAEAGRLADDLCQYMRQTAPEMSPKVSRDDADAMDFGAIVIAILGTPVASVLAKGFADWLRRHGDPELVIKTGSQQITVKKGLTSEQKVELVKTALETRK